MTALTICAVAVAFLNGNPKIPATYKPAPYACKTNMQVSSDPEGWRVSASFPRPWVVIVAPNGRKIVAYGMAGVTGEPPKEELTTPLPRRPAGLSEGAPVTADDNPCQAATRAMDRLTVEAHAANNCAALSGPAYNACIGERSRAQARVSAALIDVEKACKR